MNFRELTGLTIDEAFENFDSLNPKVYKNFKDLAFQALNKGKKKISSKMIINVIRWEIYLVTTTDDGYKINDAFTSRYARKFADDYPLFKDVFNFRQLRSA